jgi:hypothetical protein
MLHKPGLHGGKITHGYHIPVVRSWSCLSQKGLAKLDNSKQITQYLEELAKALNDLQVTIPFHILIAGGATNPPSSGTQTLIEHWNGTRWSVVASPSPGSDSILLGVGRVPHSSTVLAVGVFSNDSSHFFKSLTEFTCK